MPQTYVFETLLKQHSVASIEGKAALKAAAKPLLDKILGENQRTMMLAHLSKLCGEGDGHDYSKDIKDANKSRKTKHTDYSKHHTVVLSPLRMMIRLLLEDPTLAVNEPLANPNLLNAHMITGLPMLQEIHSYCVQNPRANTAQLFEGFRHHKHIKHLNNLYASPIEDGIDMPAEYVACFKTLIKQQVHARLDELMAKDQSQPLTPEEKIELTALLQQTDG